MRSLAGTLNYRPVVLTLWVIVVALIFPFYMFSQKELAPAEDQSFIFGIIQAAANSTIEQTRLFASQIDKVYRSFPEAQSTFEVIFPTGGVSGMGAQPPNPPKKKTGPLTLPTSAARSKSPAALAT